jgi:glutamyl-tRNA reductase
MVQFKSISQRNSSLAEREKYFKELQLPHNTPHVLLQTCDRIELYWGDGAVPEHIAHHLFSVVSGLDSSLIGECAIQGQVKNCYQDAAVKCTLYVSNNFPEEYLDTLIPPSI